MAGGVLVVSRSVNNHNYYKQTLKSKGVKNVRVTDADKDGLAFIIDEMQPDLMIMGARFYQCSTPYMMGLIKKNFSWLNMAAVCFDEYPADLGMYFVLNGVNSYFSMFDSIEQFKIGVAKILEGKEFVSEVVKDRISIRKSEPEPARRLPQKHIEVIRCICNGFNKYEIADNLYLSPRTVENYREEIYRSLNVNDIADLFRAALRLRFVTEDELIFCPRKITLKPLPNIKKEQRETGARIKDYGG